MDVKNRSNGLRPNYSFDAQKISQEYKKEVSGMEQKDTETILEYLFPQDDEIQIKLKKILIKERGFYNREYMKSFKYNEPYQFSQYHLNDYVPSRKDLQ